KGRAAPVRRSSRTMSPSGSRMQIDGTSTAARPFARGASRNSADGGNTDAAEGFLLSRIAVMAMPRRRLEHRSIAIGRHVYQMRRGSSRRLRRIGRAPRLGRAPTPRQPACSGLNAFVEFLIRGSLRILVLHERRELVEVL